MEAEECWQESADDALLEDVESLMKEGGDCSFVVEKEFLSSNKWPSEELLSSCQALLEESCLMTSDNINKWTPQVTVNAQLMKRNDVIPNIQHSAFQIDEDPYSLSDIEVGPLIEKQLQDLAIVFSSLAFIGQFTDYQQERSSLLSPSRALFPSCHHYHQHHDTSLGDVEVICQYQKYIYDVNRRATSFLTSPCRGCFRSTEDSLSSSLSFDVTSTDASCFPLPSFFPLSVPIFNGINADRVKKQVTSCLINTSLGIPVFSTCPFDMAATVNDYLFNCDFVCGDVLCSLCSDCWSYIDDANCSSYIHSFRCLECRKGGGRIDKARIQRSGCGVDDFCADDIFHIDVVTYSDGMHHDGVMSDDVMNMFDISSESSCLDLDCDFDADANILFSSDSEEEGSCLSFRTCSSSDESIDEIGRWCSCASDVVTLSTMGEAGTNAGSDFSIGKLSSSSEPVWQWNPSYNERLGDDDDDDDDDSESYSCTTGVEDDIQRAETARRQVTRGLGPPDIQHCQVLLAEGDATVRGKGECAYASSCSGTSSGSAATTSPSTLRELEDIIGRIVSSSSSYVDETAISPLALTSHVSPYASDSSCARGNSEKEEEEAKARTTALDYTGVAEGSHAVGGAENRKDETATPNSVPLPLPPSVPVEPCRLQNEVTPSVAQKLPPLVIRRSPQQLLVSVPSKIRTESSDEEVSDMNESFVKTKCRKMKRNDRRRLGAISRDERDPWSEEDFVDRRPSPLYLHHRDVSHDTYSLPSSSSSSHGYQNKRKKKRTSPSSKKRDTMHVTSSSRDSDYDDACDDEDSNSRKVTDHSDSFPGYPDDMCHLRTVQLCDSDNDISSVYALYDDKKPKLSRKYYERSNENISPHKSCSVDVVSNDESSSVTSSDACSSIVCITPTNSGSSSLVVGRPLPQPNFPPSSLPPFSLSSPPLPSLQQLSVQCQALEVKPLAAGRIVPGGSMREALQEHLCNAPNTSCGMYATKRHHSLTSIEDRPYTLLSGINNLDNKYASDSLQLEPLPSFKTQKYKTYCAEKVGSGCSEVGGSMGKCIVDSKVSGNDTPWTVRMREKLRKDPGIGTTAINTMHLSASPTKPEERDVVRALPARVLNATDRHSLSIPIPRPFFKQYASQLSQEVLKGEYGGKEGHGSLGNVDTDSATTRNMFTSELVSWRHYGENECQKPKEEEEEMEEAAAGTVSGGGWWTSGSCGDGTVGEAHDNSRCLGQVIGTVHVLVGETLCHYPLYGTSEQCRHHGGKKDKESWVISFSSNNIEVNSAVNSVGEQLVTMSGDNNNMAGGTSTPTSSSSSASYSRPLSSNISRLQSSLYGFKIANNDQMKVRNLIPLFNNTKSSSARDISNSVTFRVKSDSSWQNNRNRAKRNSDVCDMHMYRDTDSNEKSIRPVDPEEWADGGGGGGGGGDGGGGGVIKLCGVSLGSRSSSPEPNTLFRFHTLPRKSSHVRLSSLPPSPQPVLSPLAATSHSSDFVSSLPASPRLPQVPDNSPLQEVPEPFPSFATDSSNKGKDSAIFGDAGDDGGGVGGARGEADGIKAQQPLAIEHTMLTHFPPPPRPPPQAPTPYSLQPLQFCQQYGRTDTVTDAPVKSTLKVSADDHKMIQNDYCDSSLDVEINKTTETATVLDISKEHYSDRKEYDNIDEGDINVGVKNVGMDSVNSIARIRPAIQKNICTESSNSVNEVKCVKSTSNENVISESIDKEDTIILDGQKSVVTENPILSMDIAYPSPSGNRRHLNVVENKAVKETEKNDPLCRLPSILYKESHVNENGSSSLSHGTHEEYQATNYEKYVPKNQNENLFSKSNEIAVNSEENVQLDTNNMSYKPNNTPKKEILSENENSCENKNENINESKSLHLSKGKYEHIADKESKESYGSDNEISKRDLGFTYGHHQSAELVDNKNKLDGAGDTIMNTVAFICSESNTGTVENEPYINILEKSQHLPFPSSVISKENNNVVVADEVTGRGDLVVHEDSDSSRINHLILTEIESFSNPNSHAGESSLLDVKNEAENNNVKSDRKPEKLSVEKLHVDSSPSLPSRSESVIRSNTPVITPILKAGAATPPATTTVIAAAATSAAIKAVAATVATAISASTTNTSVTAGKTPVTAVSAAKTVTNVTLSTLTKEAAVKSASLLSTPILTAPVSASIAAAAATKITPASLTTTTESAARTTVAASTETTTETASPSWTAVASSTTAASATADPSIATVLAATETSITAATAAVSGAALITAITTAAAGDGISVSVTAVAAPTAIAASTETTTETASPSLTAAASSTTAASATADPSIATVLAATETPITAATAAVSDAALVTVVKTAAEDGILVSATAVAAPTAIAAATPTAGIIASPEKALKARTLEADNNSVNVVEPTSCDYNIVSVTSLENNMEILDKDKRENKSSLQKVAIQDNSALSDTTTITTVCVDYNDDKSFVNKNDKDLPSKPSSNKSDDTVIKKRALEDNADGKCRSDILSNKPRSREGSVSTEGNGVVIGRAAGISERAALIARQQQVANRPRTRTTHFPLDIICNTKMQYQQTRQKLAAFETTAASSPSSSAAYLTSSSSPHSGGGGGITRIRLSSLGQVEPLKVAGGGVAMRSKSASRIGTDHIQNDISGKINTGTIKQQDSGLDSVSPSTREDKPSCPSLPCPPVAPLDADLTNKIKLTIDSCTRSVSPSHHALLSHSLDISNQSKNEIMSKRELKGICSGGIEDTLKPPLPCDQTSSEIIGKTISVNKKSNGELLISPSIFMDNYNCENKVSAPSVVHNAASVLSNTSDICVNAGHGTRDVLGVGKDEKVASDKGKADFQETKNESRETASRAPVYSFSITAATSTTSTATTTLTTLLSPTATTTTTISSAVAEFYPSGDNTSCVAKPDWNPEKFPCVLSDSRKRSSILSYENNLLFIDEGDSDADSSRRNFMTADNPSVTLKNTDAYETLSDIPSIDQSFIRENTEFQIDQQKVKKEEMTSDLNQQLEKVDLIESQQRLREGDSSSSCKEDVQNNDSVNQLLKTREHLEVKLSEPILMDVNSESITNKYELQKQDAETEMSSHIISKENLVKPGLMNEGSASVPEKVNNTLNVTETQRLAWEIMKEVLENVFCILQNKCSEDEKNECHNEIAHQFSDECGNNSMKELPVVINAPASSYEDSFRKRIVLQREESNEEYEQALELVTPDPGHGFCHSTASVATVVRVDTPSYIQARPSFDDDEADDEFVDAKEEVNELKCADTQKKQFQQHSIPQITSDSDCQILPCTSVDKLNVPASSPSGSSSLDVVLLSVDKAATEMLTKTIGSSSAIRPDPRQPPQLKQKEGNVALEDGSASSGGHVTDPDMLASASASSTGSEISWTSGGGPVARRDLLPLEEDEDEVHWRALLAVNPPDSDEERTGYESDEDFDTMDAEMRRLDEKLRRFQRELGENIDDEIKNSSQGKPSAGPLLLRSQDLEALRISPLPEVYPAVCTAKTKHLSLMTRLQVQEYEESCSGSDSDSDDTNSSEDSADFLFVKTKIKLKPGERKCRSLDQKRPKNENILNEELEKVRNEKDHACVCEEALNLSSLALPGETVDDDSLFSGSTVPYQLDIPPPPDFGNTIVSETESNMITCLENLDCSISVDDTSLPNRMHASESSTLLGYIWHEDDGMAAVDFEGLEDFYSYEGQGALMIMFEDDMDDDCLNRGSFEEDESENFAVLHNQSPHEDHWKTDSESLSSSSHKGSSKSERTFVSAFKNSLKKASKYLGPNIENPFKKVGSPTECQLPEWPLSNNNNSVEIQEQPSCIYPQVPSPLEEEASAGVYNVQSGKVTPAQAFFPYSDNDGRDITSCSSGEYYAMPAVCVNTSDEDPAIPPIPNSNVPPAPPPRWVHWRPSVPKHGDADNIESFLPDVSWFAPPVPTALPQAVKVHHELTPKALPPPLPPPVGFPQTALPASNNVNEKQFYLVGIPKGKSGENKDNKHVGVVSSVEYNEMESESYNSVLDSGYRPGDHVLNQEVACDSPALCNLLTQGSCSCSSHCPNQRLVECDSNILPCLLPEDNFPSSQPTHKPTSVKQLKRKQQEKMLRNEVEEGVATLGCTFCMGVPVTRTRPSDNSAHWRQPSPHPKAITDRRSWPPRK